MAGGDAALQLSTTGGGTEGGLWGRCPCWQDAVPAALPLFSVTSALPFLVSVPNAAMLGAVGGLGTCCALQGCGPRGCGRRNVISQWWLRGSGPLSFLAWKNPEWCRGPSCQPQLRPAGEPAGLGGGGTRFLLPPSCVLCRPFPSSSCRLRVCACGAGGGGGSSWCSLWGWGQVGGRGVGVTQGRVLERGGNAAFCDSSVFLRSSQSCSPRPSLRAHSPA